MELSTLNEPQSRPVNQTRLRILNRMTLADRVAEARNAAQMKPAQFAKAIGISKAAMSLIDGGTTKTLKHETALAMQRVSGYRAEWINNGTLPRRLSEPAHEPGAIAQNAREETMLLLFRGLTQEQQRELVLETNARVTANREIQTRFLNHPLRTFSNEDVEAAFGAAPSPAKPPPSKPRRRSGSAAEEDPE